MDSSLSTDSKENFVSFIIFVLIVFIVIILIIYIVYLTRLNNRECDLMTNLYGKLNNNLRSINKSDPDCSGNLFDYYIKTAYNCCNGGSYRNDYVNICNLKNVLKQGVRCLDFQIFSINNEPVVSSSTSNDVYIKETFNYVLFYDAMKVIRDYAFSSSTAPNYLDPIIIHLRFQSNHQPMYSNLVTIFKSFESYLLGNDYSYENNNLNLGKILNLIRYSPGRLGFHEVQMIHASFFNAKFQVFHRCLLNQEKKFRFLQAHFCATRCDFKLVRFDSNSLTMLNCIFTKLSSNPYS